MMQSTKIPAIGIAQRAKNSDWLYWLAFPFLVIQALKGFYQGRSWDN